MSDKLLLFFCDWFSFVPMNERLIDFVIEKKKWNAIQLYFESLGQISDIMYKNGVNEMTYILIALPFHLRSIEEEEEKQTPLLSIAAGRWNIYMCVCVMCSVAFGMVWTRHSIYFIQHYLPVVHLQLATTLSSFSSSTIIKMCRQSIKPLCKYYLLLIHALNRPTNRYAQHTVFDCFFLSVFFLYLFICWLSMHFTRSLQILKLRMLVSSLVLLLFLFMSR